MSKREVQCNRFLSILTVDIPTPLLSEAYIYIYMI